LRSLAGARSANEENRGMAEVGFVVHEP
jgi:hypothetical protein